MLQRAFLRSFSLSRRNLASSFGVRWISLPLTSSFSSSSHSVTDVPHHDDSLTAKQDSSSPSWQWVPPRASKPREGQVEEVVPIIKGEYLTVEEITKILMHFKGDNIVSIPIGKEKMLDGIEHLVIVSGESSRHLRRMAEALLRQVRKRKLTKAASFRNGVEGGKVDDWLAVDCHNCLVHCLLPATRANINLEAHWGGEKRPFAMYSMSEKDYDHSLDRLFNTYPPPEHDWEQHPSS